METTFLTFLRNGTRRFIQAFRFGRHAIQLVWATSRKLTWLMAGLTIATGLLPALAAYLGKKIVDAVVHAAAVQTGDAWSSVWLFLIAEGLTIIALAGGQRALTMAQALLRAQLGHRVNVLILEKAMTLELQHFEDADFYDKLIRAQREASSRPLALIMRYVTLLQQSVTLVAFSGLLVNFSLWAVVALLFTGLPAFIAEAKFSGDAFRLFRWRSPERRKQIYLETVVAREDYAKEVQLFELAPTLLERYQGIFDNLYAEDRALTLRRGAWSFSLGLVSTLGLYAAYAWVAVSTVRGQISLGDMTMYMLLFKQGLTAVSTSLGAVSGMYEDNLYLSTLFEYLDQPVTAVHGTATRGATHHTGLVFEHVSFSYPGSSHQAVNDLSLTIAAGQVVAIVGENGSGKTTLVKLLTGLYTPTEGRVTYDGTDLRSWDRSALRQKLCVIFQDFCRYQFTVGENIAAGSPTEFMHEEAWVQAAQRAEADAMIRALPEGYHTQLGKWFKGGQELSGGQWQKVALARAFIRTRAEVMVLDEPTAALDAEAEAEVFSTLWDLCRTTQKTVLLISHRLANVRHADHIVVMKEGQIIEQGTHDALLADGGLYARLFKLQASGYQAQKTTSAA